MIICALVALLLGIGSAKFSANAEMGSARSFVRKNTESCRAFPSQTSTDFVFLRLLRA